MRELDKDVIRLAGPAIVSNITVPLLGLCDTAIAGHLGSVASIGAISVGAMMINVVIWLLTFLRMGTSGLSAVAYGSGNRQQILDVLRKALMLSGAASVIILATQIPLLKLLLWYTSPGEEVGHLASQYFRICIWGVPAQLATMAFTGWFIGQQNTRIPMVIAIGTNIINIGISLWLAFGVNIGLRGVAFGTLTANWLGAIVAGIWALRKLCRIKPDFEGDNEELQAPGVKWSLFFRVNGDLFMRSVFVMAVSISMTAFGARMGETILAVNAVMMQFFIFFSYFMDGFAFAGEALVGRYHGANDIANLKVSVKALMRWGLVMAVTFFVVYLAGCKEIASLITNEDVVIEGVDRMKLWVILLPPITVFAFLFDGIFIGLTRTRMMLGSTMLGAVAFFAISCFNGQPTSNNLILWTAFEAYLLMRGIILGMNYVVIFKNY